LLGLMPIALALVTVGSVWTAGQRIWIAHQRMAELSPPTTGTV